MFTGLIEEIGSVKNVQNRGGARKITVNSRVCVKDADIGDSINVNGVCQTVVEVSSGNFAVEAVEETIKKSNLGELKVNDKVNLESSLTLNKKLGGHFVLGHVDATGKILSVKQLQESYLVSVSYPPEYRNFITHVGSIAVDGVSLTIADFDDEQFTISVIPHTWDNTVFRYKNNGSVVNLEFDILGKYVDRMLNKNSQSKITEDWLKNLGY
jgi:riboflavin synthase